MDLLQLLGPASGPYQEYLKAHEPLKAHAGEVVSVWAAAKLHMAYVHATIDLADALDLAADTDMLDQRIAEAVREPLAEYNRIRDTNVGLADRFEYASAVATAAHDNLPAI
jgi:hypothetical protein